MFPMHRRAFLSVGLPMALGLGYGGWKTWQTFAADGPVRTDRDGKPLPAGARIRLGSASSSSGGEVTCLAFSPDSKSVAFGQTNGTLSLWTAAGKGHYQLQGLNQSFHAVAFSPDGRTLAALDQAGAVHFWKAASGKRKGNEPIAVPVPPAIEHGDIFQSEFQRIDRIVMPAHGGGSLAFTADGKTVISSNQGSPVRLWDPSDGKELRQVALSQDKKHQPGMWSAGWSALSVDAQVLATLGSGWWAGSDRQLHYAHGIMLWEAMSGKFLRRFKGPPPRVDETLQLFDGPDVGFLISRLTPTRPVSAAFSPDGKLLALPDGTNAICLWETATGLPLSSIQRPGGVLGPLAFSPDGKTAAVAENNIIRLCNVFTANELHQFPSQEASILHLAFSPDGKSLASGGSDGTVLIWELPRLCEDVTNSLSSGELASHWNALAGRDATRAHRAIQSLASAPRQTISFLETRLLPVPRSEPQRIGRLINNLDSDRLAVRQNASTELESLEETAEPALREALNRPPSLEFRRRVEQLLDKLADLTLTPDRLQAFRSLGVLEQLDSQEARRLLKKIAGGAPEARLTREARAALQRQARRS